jgi:cytochrome c biogenesis protein CcmG/thiol:disulfide interchange protein DsbE
VENLVADNEITSNLQSGGLSESREIRDSEGKGGRSSLRVIGFGVVGLVVIGFLVLMAYGIANKPSVTGQSGLTRIGKPAPQFTGQMFDGSEFDLSEHTGKPIVINFWASWCAPCRDEQPGLEAMWRAYQDDDVMFVGVNIQDDETIGRQYVDEFDVTYPNVLDSDGRVTVEYGVIGIPVTFFINKQGLVERRFVGAIGEARLQQWVDELIAGEAPAGDADAQNSEGFRQLN